MLALVPRSSLNLRSQFARDHLPRRVPFLASFPTRAVMGSADAPPVLTLVSFDVDGTLIHSVGHNANKLHKDAFAHGFKTVFGLDTNIDVIHHHGSTDPLIIIKVLQHHGIPKEQAMSKLPEVQQAMIDYFSEHSTDAAEGIQVLPGVKDLLQRLKDHGSAPTCLVTGNLEPIGWSKMRALGVLDLFTAPNFGGFGTDFCSGNTEETWRDRAEFVRVAATKCQALHPGATLRRFHVGDTPMDILAAVDAGAGAIGVSTGIYTKEQLEAVAPGKGVVVLEGLTDLDQVMKALGL